MNFVNIDLNAASLELARMNRGEIPFDVDYLEGLINTDGVSIELNLNLTSHPVYDKQIKWRWLLIDTIAGPWFSLGIHIDFKRPYIDIHFIWWIITIGNYYGRVKL